MAKSRKTKVTIEGIDDLIKTLEEMELTQQILESASKKGAEIVLDTAKTKCPVRTGNLRDSLYMSKSKNNSKTKGIYHVKIDMKKAFYGKIVELGSKNRGPKPFLRPALDRNINKINKAVADQIEKELDKL